MPQIMKDYWLLLAVGAIVFFGNLGAAPLWDRDEPRNAGCTAEMLQAGEFVVPLFNDEPRTHKPIMLYWMMMVSYAVFGINEFGARAVSAFASMGTVLLTYAMGGILLGRPCAFWSGLILASTIMFSVAARAATPDALLILCGTLAIYFFVRGSVGHRANAKLPHMPSGRDLYGMYAAMGLGVLVKGPVGVVLPGAVIGMFLLIVRLPVREQPANRLRQWLSVLRPFSPGHFLRTCWQMRPLTALATVGVVALPWYMWVHLRTQGVWTTEFFWIHNVSRASATMEGHAGPPILFYIVAILVGFFPWSVLTVPVALQTYRNLVGRQVRLFPRENGSAHNSVAPTEQPQVERNPQLVFSEQRRQALILLLCWVGVYIGLFSLAKTKLPSYVTPCYPGLAILFGHFLSTWKESHKLSIGWLKVGLAHWIVLGGALAIGLPIAAHRWLPGSEWLGIIGTIPLVGGIACWYLLGHQRLVPKAIYFGSKSEPNSLASGVFPGTVAPPGPRLAPSVHRVDTLGLVSARNTFATTAVAFIAVVMLLLPAEIGRHRRDAELFEKIRQHTGPVVAYGHLEPSWVFYGGKSIREFPAANVSELSNFLDEHPDSMLITTDRRWEPLSQDLPRHDDYAVAGEAEYFLRNRQLWLLVLDENAQQLANQRARDLNQAY